MQQGKTPSAVMYAQLKALGMANREAATALMNTQITFDGKPLAERIDESSQLSRRIVHVKPGELPRELFRDFGLSCPRIAKTLVEAQAVKRFGGDAQAACDEIVEYVTGPAAHDMAEALEACGADGARYRNLGAYVKRVALDDDTARATLAIMMLTVAGCLGDSAAASDAVASYARETLGADFLTAQTVVGDAPHTANSASAALLGLVRLTGEHIQAHAKLHVLNPEGTEIGLMPAGAHAIADVDADVSRRHAFVWRDGTRWLLRDLDSTNGTWLISGATGKTQVVALPKHERADGDNAPGAANPPIQIAAPDIIALGQSTRFMVVPIIDADA